MPFSPSLVSYATPMWQLVLPQQAPCLLGFLIEPHHRRVGKQMSINQSDWKEFTVYFLSKKQRKQRVSSLWYFWRSAEKYATVALFICPFSYCCVASLLMDHRYMHTYIIHTHTHMYVGVSLPIALQGRKKNNGDTPRHATPRYSCHMVNLSHMLYAFVCVCVCVSLSVHKARKTNSKAQSARQLKKTKAYVGACWKLHSPRGEIEKIRWN